MDTLDFLDAPQGAEPAAQPEPAPTIEPAAPPAEAQGQPRGPDGKFAPKAEAAPVAEAQAQAPATPPEAPAPAQPDSKAAPEGFVPLAALTALRDEFKAFKQQHAAPAQPPPDPYEDFEGYQAHEANQRAGERFGYSFELLQARHGEETAGKVQQWAFGKAESDPQWYQRALSMRDPFGFALEEYNRDQALVLLSDPKLLEQFRAFQSGQGPALGAPQAPQPTVVSAPPQSPTPPRSMASSPSAGGAKPGEVQLGPEEVFGSVFRS